MAKNLVLGGAGFIGGNLARALVARGEYTRILTRSSSSVSNIKDILDKVDILYRDFMDDVSLRQALKDIDVVFHLISTTFPSMTTESIVYDVFSNLLPTIRLVELCLDQGVKKIVYASSGGTIYGEPQNIPISEEHPLQPISAYGQSKLTIENYLNFYAKTTPIDVNVLRISNPFGFGQKLLGVQGIIAVAMGCAYYNRTLDIYGKGEAIRDYIYIDDVIQALLMAAKQSGSSVVNISSGKGHSVMDIVQIVEDVSKRSIQKNFIQNRSTDVNVNILDNRKAYEMYGWRPSMDLKKGCQMTWDLIKTKLD